MKFLLFIGVALSLSQNVQASLSPTLELLNLPSENRKQVLKTQGSQHVGDLRSLAFDRAQPMSIRWKALSSVAEIEGQGSVQMLLRASEAPEWYMRNAALVALPLVNVEVAEKVAVQLIQDKALVVRSAAIEVLKVVDSEKVRPLFWQELDKPYNFRGGQSLWVRSMMLEYLALKPELQERQKFERLLTDADRKIQRHASRAISRLSSRLR